MAADAPIPKWATDKRTLKVVSIASGVGLCTLIAIVAVLEPTVPQLVINVIFVPVVLVVAAIALPVIGLRMLLVRKIEDGAVPATRLLLAYVLSALPIGVATVLLGGLATVAFVLELPTAPALAASIAALLGVWVSFSLAVKIVTNLQLLMHHWAKE